MQFSDYTEIIDNCSLCLAGLKPANLFYTKAKNIYFFTELKSLLNSKDIYFEVICGCSNRIQILIYRKKMLEKLFKKPIYKSALAYFGYKPYNSIESCIDELKTKILESSFSEKKSFPNETGLFLGYPVKDVLAFDTMGGKQALCSGYWKVYYNKEKALTTFSMYDSFKQQFRNELTQGESLLKVFKLA